jgi:hydroxyacylglutathione hydrolase
MLLKYFYDSALAHASYFIGCQRTGEALIIDPGRDIDGYLETAQKEGMRITGAADTHIHADYVSGARELAEHCRAKLYLSDEGPADWKYHYVGAYNHQLLRHGDTFHVGNIGLEVVHTPGHTPESISYVLTDHGGGASTPMGIFTGDFVFVGSIGRPDLLEEAAGLAGTAERGARDLYQSTQRFHEFPDHLQIWPAHGSGSACGKGLGSIPSSTVGYEKLYNPALQFSNEQAFVDYILSEQPEAPKYFAIMKQVNKDGPEVLGDSPLPELMAPASFSQICSGNQLVDCRPASAYADGHASSTINIPLKYLAAWAGWLVDYEKPLYLICSSDELPEAKRILNKIGIDHLAGYFNPKELESADLLTQSYEVKSPAEIAPLLETGEITLIDVRGDSEWKEEYIPGARRCFLAELPELLTQFSGSCTLVFQCRSGGRSAIAASIASAAGVHKVVNLSGGIHAWKEAGFPVTKGATNQRGPGEQASVGEGASQSQAIFWDAQCPS